MVFVNKFARALMVLACLSSALQPIAAHAVSSYTLRVPVEANKFTPTSVSVEFGTVPVGPMQQTTGFYKNSTTAPVTLSASHFSVFGAASLQNNNCLGTLQPGAACSFTAGLAVPIAGPSSGRIEVYPGGPLSNMTVISMTATGVATLPTLTTTPQSLNFGSVPLNSLVTNMTPVTISNIGSTSANIVSVTSSSTNFVVDSSQCHLVLPAGESCVMYVGFGPRQLGTLTSNLRVNLAGGTSVPIITVVGSGVQGTPTWILPPDFSFLNLVEGEPSPVRSATLQNTGKGDLNIVVLAVQGDPAIELVGHNCPAVLAPTASCQVDIRALVNDTIVHGAEIVLSTTQSSQPLTKVPVIAQAAFSLPILTPSIVEFFDIPLGQTAVQTLILENFGSKPFDILSLMVDAPFTLDTNCQPTVYAKESCLINVTFEATEVGEKWGAVQLTTNATTDPNPTADIWSFVTSEYGFDVSAASLNFGGVILGQNRQLTLEVINSGNYTTTLQAPLVTGANFTATHNCQAIAPGGSCFVTVTFAPTAVGAIAGNLELSNGQFSRQVSLTGTGLASSLQVTPSPVNFGLVEVGTASTLTVGVTNVGNLTVSPAKEISGPFQITSDGCTNPLVAGASCTLQVSFTPSAAQLFNGVLTLSGATGGAVATQLLGEGYQVPVTALDPSSSSLNFGNVAVGANKSLNLLIQNTGNTTFTLDSVTANSAAYTAVHSCASVAPGGDCAISVTFAPTVAGAQPSDLTLSSGGVILDIIAMAGTGIDTNLVITPAPYNYGDVSVGSEQSQVFAVANQGALAASFGATVGEGFSVTASTCGATLVPGANCAVTVSFNPLELKAYSSALALTEGSGKVTQAALTGTGIEPAAPPAVWTVNPSSLNFGSVEYGLSKTLVLTVRNDGTASLPAFDFTVSEPMYTVVNDCGASLAPAQLCYLTVTYTPSTWGVSEPATLGLIQSGETRNVSLTGSSPEKKTLVITGDNNFGVYNLSGGTAVQRTFTVTNQSAAASVSNLSFNVGTATTQPFYRTVGQDSCSGQTLAAGASCAVTVTFKPTAEGTFSQALTVTDGAGTEATTTMVGRGGSPVFDISPTSIDFGKIVAGTTVSRTVEVRNTDASLAIGALSVSGAGTRYTVNTSACVNVAPGASCLVTVTFNPGTAIGQHAASIVFSANGASRTLAATGYAGDLYVEAPAIVDLSTVEVNSVISVPLTYTNIGTLPVSISSSIYSQDGVALNAAELPACANLAVGASCTTTVNIKVTAQDFLWGEIEVYGRFQDSVSGQNEELYIGSVLIMGEGRPGHLLGSAAIAYGDVALGTSLTRSVVLTNLSNQPLNVASIQATGSTAFSPSHNCLAVAPGAYCYISATFTPEQVGPASGSLTVVAEGGMPAMTISLDGTGSLGSLLEARYNSARVGATFYQDTLIADMGRAAAGTVYPQNGYSVEAYPVTLTNLSGVTFSLSSLAATNAVIVGSDCGLSLAGGASCTVAMNLAISGTPTLTAVFRTPVGAEVSAVVPWTYTEGVAYGVSDVDFGTMTKGVTGPVSRTVTITNNTPQSTPFTLSLPSSSFTSSNLSSACAGNVLPAASSCTFTMTLSPTEADYASFSSGTVTLTGNYGAAYGSVYADLRAWVELTDNGGGGGGLSSESSPSPIVIQGPSYMNPGFDLPQYYSYASQCGYPLTNSQANQCQTQYLSQQYGRFCQVETLSGPYPYFTSFRTVCR